MEKLYTLKETKLIPYAIDIMKFRKNIINYIKHEKEENSGKKLKIHWGLNDQHFPKEIRDDNQGFIVMEHNKDEWDDLYNCGKVVGKIQILAHIFNITDEDLK